MTCHVVEQCAFERERAGHGRSNGIISSQQVSARVAFAPRRCLFRHV